MEAEIVDFYDARLSSEAVLKVFNSITGEELFQTNLGRDLFRRTGPEVLTFNRDVSVQYKYVRPMEIEVEAYIYLGDIPCVTFPRANIVPNNMLRFDMKRDTVVRERNDGFYSGKTTYTPPIKTFLIGAGFMALLLWLSWLTWRLW